MIVIQELTHAFKKHTALNKITLDIPNGLVGLLGENGAGKTTLMKIMSTLIPIQDGSIIIEGNKIERKRYSEIRKLIGFMPQEFDFFPNFTVREIMEYHCLIGGVEKMKIKQEIERLIRRDETQIRARLCSD